MVKKEEAFMRVLLVEDEKRMAEALVELLRLEKYEVDWCDNGREGCDYILSDIYDIIILDVMLPGMSGFDIVKEVRREGIKTPILILTAKGDLEDRVTGLDNGADDYLIKPFMTKELLARIRALIRRMIHTEDGTLAVGDISLDINTSTLCCIKTGQNVRLSEKEFKIMEYLITNQGQIVSREQIARKIWGYDNEAEYNNVEVYLSFTRKKIAFIESAVEIKAVRGLGYELRMRNV